MTLTNYHALLALELATLALLVVPPALALFRLIREGEQDTEAAKRRIAARALARTNLPAIQGGELDPEEEL
jgi:hypothetical protein